MLKAIWNAVRFILGADDAPAANTASNRPAPAPVASSHPIGPEATAPAAEAPAPAPAAATGGAKQAPAKKAKKAGKSPAKSKSKS